MAVYKIKIYDSTGAATENNIGALATDVIMADGKTTLTSQVNTIVNNITNLDKNKASTNAATQSTAGLMSASDKTKLDKIDPEANKYTLPQATTTTLGGVIVGNGLNISAGKISLAAASTGSMGGVQIGSGLSVNSGLVSLNTATASQLGGVKIGSGLSIADGVVSLNLPTASSSTLGGVKVGGGIGISNGIISVRVRDVGTSSSAGHISVNLEGTSQNIKVAGWDNVQGAADIINNGGSFTKVIKAAASSDASGMLRNIQYTTEDPGAGNSGYGTANNGLLICVYE